MADELDIAAVKAFGGGVDFGKTAADYRKFRAGFPDAFFAALSDRGYARAGQRALDVGTGTGTVARGLARMGLTVGASIPPRRCWPRRRRWTARRVSRFATRSGPPRPCRPPTPASTW